ncbi:MAG: phenylalanine--tRNA ligase subunit beta [Methylophilaceae bacterium]|nr:phenylalanine--tRNA ligase subunit beta [Methylophilaceae bacterium]
MQFSENWLRQFVNPTLNTEELSHALTMAGLEVENLQPVGTVFSKVVIGKILSTEKHPDADRLQVCKVDVGLPEPLQIVCGANNARAGLFSPCALVGAELPGMSIKAAKVRGVESFGMMCSAKELDAAAEPTGLLELPDDVTIGQDIREYLGLDDKLFTIKLTPNRSDCLSLLGIARDVAAITGAPLNTPDIQVIKPNHQATKKVIVIASEACPRYCGRLISGVNAQAKTPDWMLRCLNRSGIRSISAIVDITNYVLLELGQPMHAFDADKLQGDIIVRFAKAEEPITLLNHLDFKLAADDLVIADDNGAIALAGIMGGVSTSLSDNTTNIFLESAFFTPDTIAGKARRLGLITDSSYRFERGVDYGNTLQALERASALVLEICGGSAGAVSEIIGITPSRQAVDLRLAKLISLLGIVLSNQQVAKIFTQLGFDYTENNDVFTVMPPSYRFDIAIEEDLIEEIARLHGYEHIPAVPPQAVLNMLSAPESRLSEMTLRHQLVADGYQEVITYSFVDENWERDLLGNKNTIKLKNPISSNLSVMRSGLWGGLIDTLVHNLNRKQSRAQLFEVGSSYSRATSNTDNAYEESQRISGLFYGSFAPEQWTLATRDVDFYDVKSTVDELTQGRAEYLVASDGAQHPALHPGQSAKVFLKGKAIGWIGKLHPKWQQQYDLPKSTILFELEVAPLLNRKLPKHQELSKTLPIRRDLALIVNYDLPVQTLLNAIKMAEIPLITEVSLFDIYKGKGIDSGKKSLAFLVLMQDTHKTLVDNDADAAMAKLLDVVKIQFGAILRA